MTKQIKVLEYLKTNGSITSLEAIENFGATRLSAIIFNLKKNGVKIEKENIRIVDRFGDKTYYAKYKLINK